MYWSVTWPCCAMATFSRAVRFPLPVEFLCAAALGYCGPAEQAQAPANWFEEALDYAPQPLSGAAAALDLVRTA
ncbi:hypothetical protein ACRB68_70010 [Actinomadura sp. RB68]|uniref:Uncharacterized protein n=2 Tax=Actinomadura macrotermitis TaxID=2585200 RepID=A0A7K0C615_9ACTN|nr:hypothetical protein [Actinomadura macrotermitis]